MTKTKRFANSRDCDGMGLYVHYAVLGCKLQENKALRIPRYTSQKRSLESVMKRKDILIIYSDYREKVINRMRVCPYHKLTERLGVADENQN